MKALILNCTLKAKPEQSSTELLADVLIKELEKLEVDTEMIRMSDYNVMPGVSSDEGGGDEWPSIHDKITNAEILVMASPTWVGRMSSMAQKAIERMDALLSEQNDDGTPVAYNRVAGFLSTGNEDGAKHTIGEMAACLIDIGFTVPGQAYSFFNNGSAMGDDYKDSKNQKAKENAEQNAKNMAHILVQAANALQRNRIEALPYS